MKVYFILLMFLASPIYSSTKPITISKVSDGDTVILSDDRRVRLIGVDTTEKSDPRKPLQYFSAEATEFLRKLIEGKEVELKYDEQKIDKYERTLAYIHVKRTCTAYDRFIWKIIHGDIFLYEHEDHEVDIFVNKEIIRQGYGFAYIKFPFKYKKEFVEAETEAREASRGLWKEGGKAEIIWVLYNKQKPFQVYEMTNKLWGLKYKNFCFTRKTLEEIANEIKETSRFTNELIDRDLWIELKKRGWEKIGGNDESKE